MREFWDFKWLDIEHAKEQIELKYYRDTLERFVTFMDW